MMKRSKIIGISVGIGTFAFLLWLILFANPSQESAYRRFPDPSGNYEVVVHKKMSCNFAMPGQSGDSPGIVLLFDKKGRVLQKGEVAMLGMLDSVEWSEESVSIGAMMTTWKLPKSKAHGYRITASVLADLENSGLPESVLSQLHEFQDRLYRYKKGLLIALQEKIGEQAANQYQEMIFAAIEREKAAIRAEETANSEFDRN